MYRRLDGRDRQGIQQHSLKKEAGGCEIKLSGFEGGRLDKKIWGVAGILKNVRSISAEET